MSSDELLMAAELRESPEVLSRQSDLLRGPIGELCRSLKKLQPRVVVTCGRGSSAYAATFGKHLIERYLGLPVAAAAPSITTVYGRNLHLENQFFLAISQSGRSDDLIEAAASARAAGALTAAIVNDVNSPLKWVAGWADDASLDAALNRLPKRLAEATHLDWSHAVVPIASVESLVALGRGPTLAIAQEAALKLKEVCNLHAEAYSGAEFQHGPIALVSRDYPILIFSPADKSAQSLTALATELCRKGAAVFTTGRERRPGPVRLPVLKRGHPETDAVCLIQSFYRLAIHLATHRGVNADQPRNLQKVTRTR